MENFRHVVPVVSGKGGVGKSTVAVNLAVSLGQLGVKTALVDADFYGPSVPLLMGYQGGIAMTPEGMLTPAHGFGIEFMSIGLLLRGGPQPVIWRGPMLHKMIDKLFNKVAWYQADICIVDMTPGTGDAALSLSELVPLNGALVVTTPQEVALSDVRKVIGMLEKLAIRLVGIVENMAGFYLPGGECVDIFGAGGGEKLAQEYKSKVLAQIPIEPSIRESGDRGVPAASVEGS